MKKTIKIKKNYEYQRILKKGKYFGGEVIECFCLNNTTAYNHFGIAISSKLGNAVQRNRIKRRVREAYYTLEEQLEKGYSFVFLWKKKVSIEKCSYHKVLKDMQLIFQKIGMKKNDKNIN